MSLSWQKINKNRREASYGIHHYSIDGNYYYGWEVFYATGETKPPKGPDWKVIASGNSIGKCEPKANRHFRQAKAKEQRNG